MLMKHLGLPDEAGDARKDSTSISSSTPSPNMSARRLPPQTDVFGCRFRSMDYGTGRL